MPSLKSYFDCKEDNGFLHIYLIISKKKKKHRNCVSDWIINRTETGVL